MDVTEDFDNESLGDDIDDDNGEFMCECCRRIFSDPEDLDQHMDEAHSWERECRFCRQTFFSGTELHAHIKANHEMKPTSEHKCFLCNTFVTDVERHIQNLHECSKDGEAFAQDTRDIDDFLPDFASCVKAQYRCHVHMCSETMDHKFGVLEHMTKHGIWDTNICDICKKRVNTRELLHRHVEDDHKISRQNICPYCTEVFVVSFELEDHIVLCPGRIGPNAKWHNQVSKPSLITFCRPCKLPFSSTKEYNEHMAVTHSRVNTVSMGKAQEEPEKSDDSTWKCEHCRKEFSRESYLQQHLELVHRHFKCVKCDKQFSNHSEYQGHACETDDGSLRYKCSFCDKMYLNISSKIKHEDMVHFQVKRHKCDICAASFYQRYSLRLHVKAVHMKEVNHRCLYCHKPFFKKTNMQVHMERQHNHQWQKARPSAAGTIL